MKAVGADILRGSGRQSLGAWINILAYYLLGLPTAFFLAFQIHWNLQGFWAGITGSLTIVSISMCAMIFYSDWEELARKA